MSTARKNYKHLISTNQTVAEKIKTERKGNKNGNRKRSKHA